MRAGNRGLRLSRKALGLPFKIARKVGGIFSPKKKIKTWGRRLRRLALIVVGLIVLSALAPVAVVLSDDGGEELAAILSAGAAADQLSRQNNDDIGAATGPDGAMGTVAGIPYAEVFNRAGQDHGVDPRLLAAVAWAESGFSEDVIECRRASRAGAQGIMQLMPGTARLLRVDACRPDEAIPGGARYLKQQKDRFGTWENALAAYNWGPEIFARWARDPESVPDGRPPENIDYVRKVMAKWEEYKRQFPNEQIAGGVDASADRQAILERAQSWLDIGGVRYSQSDYHDGWRQDCSGYVSMAWNLRNSSGRKISATTVTMASTYAEPISKEALLPGDIMLDADSGNGGHVVLFERWDENDPDYYWGYEQSGSRNTGHRRFHYEGFYGPPEYRPYRWDQLSGSGGGGGSSNAAA